MKYLTPKARNLLRTYPNEIFWVDSNNGKDTNKGTFDRPLATLLKASTLANHDTGDVIVLKPGHTEIITTDNAQPVTKRGLHVIGLGNGNARPTFTVADVNACFQISVANVYIENIIGTTSVTGVLALFDIEAPDNVVMQSIETNDPDDSTAASTYFKIDSGAEGIQILDHVHKGSISTVAARVYQVGGPNNKDTIIIPKSIIGNFSNSILHAGSSAAVPNLQFLGRASSPAYLRNYNSADVIVNAHANTTGRVGPYLNLRLADNAANITEALNVGKMEIFQPINLVNADGESSLQANNTASTDA